MADVSKLEKLQSQLQKAQAEYLQAFQDVWAELIAQFERNMNLLMQQKSCQPAAHTGLADSRSTPEGPKTSR